MLIQKKKVIFYLIAKEAKREKKERNSKKRCVEEGQGKWQRLSRNMSPSMGSNNVSASLCLVFLVWESSTEKYQIQWIDIHCGEQVWHCPLQHGRCVASHYIKCNAQVQGLGTPFWGTFDGPWYALCHPSRGCPIDVAFPGWGAWAPELACTGWDGW